MLRRIECDRYTSASDLRCDGVKQRGIQNGAGRSVNHGDVGSAGVSGEIGAAGMIDIERKDGRRRVSGVSQSGTSGVQPRKEEARGLRGYGAADSRKIWRTGAARDVHRVGGVHRDQRRDVRARAAYERREDERAVGGELGHKCVAAGRDVRRTVGRLSVDDDYRLDGTSVLRLKGAGGNREIGRVCVAGDVNVALRIGRNRGGSILATAAEVCRIEYITRRILLDEVRMLAIHGRGTLERREILCGANRGNGGFLKCSCGGLDEVGLARSPNISGTIDGGGTTGGGPK